MIHPHYKPLKVKCFLTRSLGLLPNTIAPKKSY